MNMDPQVQAVVLAAGMGTRMKSKVPKVLHPLGGKPLLWHVLHTLDEAGIEKRAIVVGHLAEQVKAAFPEEKLVSPSPAAGHSPRCGDGQGISSTSSRLRFHPLRGHKFPRSQTCKRCLPWLKKPAGGCCWEQRWQIPQATAG